MSKLIVSMMTSVDGFIEGPNRELDWPVESPDFNAYCDDMLDHTDTMLFGRVSYEMMVKYWPAAETHPKDEWEWQFAPKMNRRPKIVVSRTLDRAEWSNTRVVKGNLAEECGCSSGARSRTASCLEAPVSSRRCAGLA